MKDIRIFLVLVMVPLFGFGQVGQMNRGTAADRGENREGPLQDQKPPITSYKIISVTRDTTFVDTSLTIEDDYQFNYLRRDRFELLPFSNVGQTYNKLAYDFRDDNLIPQFGARARHYNYFEVEDIYYYNVPTPLTELFYRTVFEQGQVLDALFTVNTSPNLNFSIAYKGMRSLGKYQHILTSTGNFRATINYNTRNRKYFARTHFVSQDLMNQENGGLTPLSLQQYLAEVEEIQDRSRLDVNFENAESTLFGKRFYLDHFYMLTGSAVSEGLAVGHKLNFSDKEYLYEQAAAHPMFGPAYENVNLRDETNLEHVYNEAFVNYNNEVYGNFRLKAGLTNYNYGYNSALILETGVIGNRLKGKVISAGGEYSGQVGDLNIFADGMVNVSGEFGGHYFKGGLSIPLLDEMEAIVSVSTDSQAPNFNFLLYQSDYVNYNWENNLSNVSTRNLKMGLVSNRFGEIEVDYTNLVNYAFFGLNEGGYVKPMQYDGNVNYFKIKAEKEFMFGKFALNNTLLYQKVTEGGAVLNVPEFISRNTIYYHDHWFQRALYLQTGLTLNYFTEYFMNAYDPVLSEFFVQNEQALGGFPRVDFFFNGKIQQARIFFKLEHVNSLITGNNNFSAPLYPYRDFGVRFGLVWNFFM